MMQKPIHLADSLKLPLYCGEFGVYRDFFPAAKRPGTKTWYRSSMNIISHMQTGIINQMHFGIVDENMKPLVPIIKILTGK